MRAVSLLILLISLKNGTLTCLLMYSGCEGWVWMDFADYVDVRPRVDYHLKKNWPEGYSDIEVIGIGEQEGTGSDVNNIRMSVSRYGGEN
ncbi:9866_t:CDS:2 [Acaulospora morrowiae]|uniref:9866_t:CDS:1 n=1 Tax=Acaulospora morrowiae TaxID=94023 RepID=A0A9N9ANX8_9GLOM|nr:9866_t:CDS:2 [Acaulospora morrowiae]